MPISPTREELIDVMLREGQEVPEPGMVNPIVHQGDDSIPPMVQKALSAGHILLYDTATGESSVFPKPCVKEALHRKRPNGSYVFTSKKPDIEPFRGTIKCLLHPLADRRAEFERMGLPTCPVANIPNEFQLTRHMEVYHKSEWAAIKMIEEQVQRAEAKLAQEQQQALLIRLVGGTPAPRKRR